MFEHKRRLLIFVSVLLAAGFFITSLTSYFISLNSLRRHVVDAELPLTSDNIYSEIQRDLLRPIFVSSLMASDTFLRDWVIRGERDHSEITRYLSEIQSKYNAVTAFFVSDNTHNYYHVSGILKQVSPENQRDDWYFRVRELDNDYEINVDVDMANDDALTVFVNYRVFDYDGRFIGATGVGLSVDAVKQAINRYQSTYNRTIFFIDRKGRVKISNTASQVNQGYLEEIGRKIITGSPTSATSAPTTTHTITVDDRNLIVNTRFIDDFGWHLLVVNEEIEGHEELLESLLISLAACALIIIIVLSITHRTISIYQREVERLATNDKLTGLFNRQAMDIIYRQITLDLKRNPGKLSVILFDIDRFKLINDELGHLAGDSVLRHLAQICNSRLRETDIISRWGGEEFVVLVKNCSLQEAENIAEELRLSVMNNPTDYQGRSIRITISAGVTEYRAQESQDEVFERADRALYRAKNNGRNQVVSIAP